MWVMAWGCKRCLSSAFNDGFWGMWNLKKLISEYGIYKIYGIRYFAISAFTCLKQIAEKKPKKLRHSIHNSQFMSNSDLSEKYS